MKRGIFKVAAMSIIAAATLVACGGGGGGTSGTGSTVTPAAADPGNLITTMPPSTYAAISLEAQAFSELNTMRIGGGFGAVRQNSNLDKAASNHLAYFFTKWFNIPFDAFKDGTLDPLFDSNGRRVVQLAPNNGYFQNSAIAGWLNAHVELPGESGFTGELPADRAAAAGYGFPKTATEVLGLQNRGPYPSSCIAGLLAGPYHRATVLNPAYTEIGIAMMPSTSNAGILPCVINPAQGSTPGRTPENWIAIYPSDKSANLPAFIQEAPNPWPEYAQIGTSPSVFVTPGHTIKVDSFTIAGPDGVNLESVVLTTQNDKYKGIYILDSQAFLLPKGFLRSETTYTVKFSGKDTNAGGEKAIAKSWTFTTQKYCEVGAVCK